MHTANCKCDGKKWFLTGLVVAVAYAAMDYLIHHKLLIAVYQANAHLWRTPADTAEKMWWLWLNYLIFGLLFTCIYSKGYESEKAGGSQGLRYGFLVGIFYWITHMMGSFPFHPWPTTLYKSWFGLGLAEFTILGVLVGLLYRPKTA